MKTALVVIDVQNYFVNEKTKDLPAKINSVIKSNKFDYVLFTQFVNKKDSNFVKLLHWRKMFSSPDIDIYPTLANYVTKENTFQKTSYSICKANGFTAFLKKHNITKLFLCGIDTDSCILASAFDAFDLGYDVTILEDLCQSHSGDEFHEAAKKIFIKSLHKRK